MSAAICAVRLDHAQVGAPAKATAGTHRAHLSLRTHYGSVFPAGVVLGGQVPFSDSGVQLRLAGRSPRGPASLGLLQSVAGRVMLYGGLVSRSAGEPQRKHR